MKMSRCLTTACLAFATTLAAVGCSGDSAQREQDIRDQAAKAAADAKPKIEEAGRAVKAAVEGAKEGWEKGVQKKVDINDATEEELTGLPGVGKRDARRIIAGRPYHDAHELLSRKVIAPSTYDKLKNDVTAK